MLKGQAKTNYQREYMRSRRKKQVVRPSELNPVRPTVKILHGGKYIDVIKPELDADGNEIPEY